MPSDPVTSFPELARLVSEKVPAIIERWEAAVRERVPAAEGQTRHVLVDSMPLLLERLASALGAPEAAPALDRAVWIASDHGQERADLGTYSVSEVIFEYQLLRYALVGILEEETAIPGPARQLIHDFLDLAIRIAVQQFAETERNRYTAQKADADRAREALANESHKLQTMFAESPAAMAFWRGHEHVFEMANEKYRAVFPGRDLIGRPLFEAVPELRGQGFDTLLNRVLETGVSFTGREVPVQIADGIGGELRERYYDFSYVRVADAGGAPYGVYVHAIDVTDRVEARRDLERSRALLEASVRDLESERDLRDRFVAALTHDLRTPLTAASMSTQLLQRRAADPETLREGLRKINLNLQRADRMINDLLDASAIKAGEGIPVRRSTCDLAQLAKDVARDLTIVYGDRFEVDGSEGAPPVHADPGAVRRILENLAGNAVKYGAEKGVVTIRSRTDGGFAELSVHNRGEPITPEDQAVLFRPYGRTAAARNGSQKGWGIGLTLVKGLAEAHGGRVRVESDAERGTTFIVDLPAGGSP